MRPAVSCGPEPTHDTQAVPLRVGFATAARVPFALARLPCLAGESGGRRARGGARRPERVGRVGSGRRCHRQRRLHATRSERQLVAGLARLPMVRTPIGGAWGQLAPVPRGQRQIQGSARLALLPLPARLLEMLIVLVLAQVVDVVQLGRIVGAASAKARAEDETCRCGWWPSCGSLLGRAAALANIEEGDQLFENIGVAKGLGVANVLVDPISLLQGATGPSKQTNARAGAAVRLCSGRLKWAAGGAACLLRLLNERTEFSRHLLR